MFVQSVHILTKTLILEEMKSNDFIHWLDGFLHGKNGLSIDEIRYIQNKMSEVDLSEIETDKRIIIEKGPSPMNPITIQEPIKEDDMEFPGKPPKIYM